MENNNNIKAMLEELDAQTTDIILDFDDLDEDENDRPKMWSGTVCAHLIDIIQDDNKNILMVFADSNNVPMPSQYPDKAGNIYAGKNKTSLLATLNNFKYALHMDATIKGKAIITELQKPHDIVFYVNGTMMPNGMWYTNRVNFQATAQL